MIFNCLVVIDNLVRLIHRKYIKCSLEINLTAESHLEKDGFPNYDILYQNVKDKVKEELKDAHNSENDPYEIDFKEISIVENEKIELLPPKYYGHEIANKSFYSFRR